TIWTLAGLPCLSMPLLVGRDDMPIGIQLVGAKEQDDRLFRTARWLLEFLSK
ncbi:MAG: amidase family protein, partial [Gammaproteobacteria bacterium]|nr:amidase family protein [Gammaproteobacteria bacterium]